MSEINKLKRIHEQLVKRGVDKYYYRTEDIGALLDEINELQNVTQSGVTVTKNTSRNVTIHGGKLG